MAFKFNLIQNKNLISQKMWKSTLEAAIEVLADVQQWQFRLFQLMEFMRVVVGFIEAADFRHFLPLPAKFLPPQ